MNNDAKYIFDRITPAGAGKSKNSFLALLYYWDHPAGAGKSLRLKTY
ncbi:hypothetical protein LPICM02_240011 [Pseudolactococcus piscium]|nr:hypothetical protein LPICM02_240011 [Lactococcus piscium]